MNVVQIPSLSRVLLTHLRVFLKLLIISSFCENGMALFLMIRVIVKGNKIQILPLNSSIESLGQTS